MLGSSLALAFTTFQRPHVAQRLIRSVRRRFPEMPIYVADQSRFVEAMTTFYANQNVKLIRMDYDAGVCASRNKLVEAIAEEYFLLCDDDFIFGTDTDFSEAVRILEAYPDIGIVGGRLYDLDGSSDHIRRWELFFHYDIRNRIFTSVPIDRYAPSVRELGGIRFFLCDAVLNFALFRRSLFSSGIHWDERFKSNGEHEDFFLNLKTHSHWRVAYLPTMTAFHHHPTEYKSYFARLRQRTEGWKLFMEKWGIDQHLEIDYGLRTTDDFNSVFNQQQVANRFFLNSDLSLRRLSSEAGSLSVIDLKRIVNVGGLDERGEPTRRGPLSGSLLVEAGTRRLFAPPAGAELKCEDQDSDAETSRRKGLLEPPADAATDLIPDDRPIFFRYDPVRREDTDFILWYRAQQGSPEFRARRYPALLVRWYAHDGRVLVWDFPRKVLDLDEIGYWQPLLLEVPLWPGNCPWMRFELVGESGTGRIPVCTGFIFSTSQAAARTSPEEPENGCDVLALSASNTAATETPDAWSSAGSRAFATLPPEPESVSMTAPHPHMRLIEVGRLSGPGLPLSLDWNGPEAAYSRWSIPSPDLAAPHLLVVPDSALRTAG
jgi:GT2 family glycosyltransferase